MMNRIDESLEQLVSAVIESDVYQQYQKMREKIKQEPEKEQAIHNFRRRNYMLQRTKDNVDMFEEIDRLEQEFAQFRQEPLVEEYLSAELALCRMIQKINLRLMEQVEFDLGFFDQ